MHKDAFGKPIVFRYSGPTYIAIRSKKQLSSNALTHPLNFNNLFDLIEFRDITKNGAFVKPVIILSVDGGPDKNPHYQRVLFTLCAK